MERLLACLDGRFGGEANTIPTWEKAYIENHRVRETINGVSASSPKHQSRTIGRQRKIVIEERHAGAGYAGFFTHAILIAVIAFTFWPLIEQPGWIVSDGHTDLVHGHLPYRILMADSLRNLRGLPNYDPTAFGGIPLSADPQAGMTYPPNWLHALSSDGGAHWFGWLMVLHCVVAGIATLWWLNGLGFSSAARLAGAIALVLAGKWFHHVVASGHVGMLALAWVPWQLGLIGRICSQARLRDVAWLAAATALVVHGAHPQFLLYSQLVVGGYALCVWLSTNSAARLRSAPLLAAAACLALGLSARYLLPILDGLEIFVRSEGLPRAAAAWMSIRPHRLIELILPAADRFGRSTQVIFIGSASIAISLYALLCVRRRAASIGFFALLGLLVVYALGPKAGVQALAHDWLPGFSLFRIPPRVLLVSGLPMAYLVAAGLTRLGAERPGRLHHGLAGALLFAGVGVCVAEPSGDGVWAGAGLAVPAAITLSRQRLPTGWPIWTGVAIVALQGLRFAAPLVQTQPPETALPSSPIAETLNQAIGEGRVLGIDSVTGPATIVGAYDATRNGIESLRGYNPLVPRATRELLAEAAGISGAKMRWFASTIRIRNIENRTVLDLFNTQWIVSPRLLGIAGLTLSRSYGPDNPRGLSAAAGTARNARQFVYENTMRMPRAGLVRRARAVADRKAALRAIGQRDPREVVFVNDPRLEGSFPGSFQALSVQRDGDRAAIDVDAGDGGYLVISELACPGWRARIDGREAVVHTANGYFVMLALEAGRHAVELTYRPRSVQLGNALTGLSLLGFFSLLLWRRSGR